MVSYWTVPVHIDMQWFEEHAARHAQGDISEDPVLPDNWRDAVWEAFRKSLTPMLIDAATAAIGKGVDGPETQLPGCKRGVK